MLSDRCLSVCPVCNVGVLWSNGWMDQDETWHAGRPRPWPHYVRWGPSSPSPKEGGAPNICCGQMVGWIKMPLGMEEGLGPGDFVLHGDPAPLPKKGRSPLPIFGPCPLWPNSWMDRNDTRHRGGSWSRLYIMLDWDPSPCRTLVEYNSNFFFYLLRLRRYTRTRQNVSKLAAFRRG